MEASNLNNSIFFRLISQGMPNIGKTICKKLIAHFVILLSFILNK